MNEEEKNPFEEEENGSSNEVNVAKEKMKEMSKWKNFDNYIDSILFYDENTLHVSGPQMTGMGMGMPGPQMTGMGMGMPGPQMGGMMGGGMGGFNPQMNMSGPSPSVNYMQRIFGSIGIENLLKLRINDLLEEYEHIFKNISINLNEYIDGEIRCNPNTWFENIKRFILSELDINDTEFTNELESFGSRIGIMKGFITSEEKQILNHEIYSVIRGDRVIKHNIVELADFIIDASKFILRMEKIVLCRYPIKKQNYEIKEE
jgi:hypothetical protein